MIKRRRRNLWRNLTLIAAIFAFVGIGEALANESGPTPAQRLGMKLKFNEEFERFSQYLGQDGQFSCRSGGVGTWLTTLNGCRRMHEYRDKSGQLITHHELQIYMDPTYTGEQGREFPQEFAVNPFSVRNGVLDIRAAPTDSRLQPYVGGRYTSGIITTQYSFAQEYGYFEARLKLPMGKGLWPAFWLLSADNVRPPEIDILEAFTVPNDKGDGGRMKVHYHSIDKPTSDPNAKGECKGWYDVGVDISAGFHNYGADVEPDGITFYFDGRPYQRCGPNPTVHGPLYILINLAVGGDWPGAPDGTNTWPADLLVKYVRVYGR